MHIAMEVCTVSTVQLSVTTDGVLLTSVGCSRAGSARPDGSGITREKKPESDTSSTDADAHELPGACVCSCASTIELGRSVRKLIWTGSSPLARPGSVHIRAVHPLAVLHRSPPEHALVTVPAAMSSLSPASITIQLICTVDDPSAS